MIGGSDAISHKHPISDRVMSASWVKLESWTLWRRHLDPSDSFQGRRPVQIWGREQYVLTTPRHSQCRATNNLQRGLCHNKGRRTGETPIERHRRPAAGIACAQSIDRQECECAGMPSSELQPCPTFAFANGFFRQSGTPHFPLVTAFKFHSRPPLTTYFVTERLSTSMSRWVFTKTSRY